MSTQNSRVLMSIQYEWASSFYFCYSQTLLRIGIINIGVLMSTQYEGMNEQLLLILGYSQTLLRMGTINTGMLMSTLSSRVFMSN